MKFDYPDYSHSIEAISDSSNSYISRISGYLDRRNERQIRADTLKSIDSEATRVFFDLSGLEYLSSSGIELFEKVLRKMKDTRNGVILYGIKESVSEVLEMYGYRERFRSFETLKEAQEFTVEWDKRHSKYFEPFNIRCLKCSSSQVVRAPGSFTCSACGTNHSVSLNGEVELEAVTARNTKVVSLDKSVRIGIFGERELIDLLKKAPPFHTHCISIGNPSQDLPSEISKSYISVLRLEFYDVDSIDDLMPEQEKRIPEPADVLKVINFFRSTNTAATGYDIHCWQGVSRSTAIGLGLLKLMGYDEDALESILLSLRPGASPHKRLVQYFDKELGSHLVDVAETIHLRKIAEMRRELEELARQQ